MYNYIFKGLFAVLGLVMLVYYARRKHTIASALSGMLSGAIALGVLHYFGQEIGYAPPLNLFNTSVSLILGAPGVMLLLAANVLI